MSNIPEWLIEGIREEEAKWKATEESSSAPKLFDERIGQQFPSDTADGLTDPLTHGMKPLGEVFNIKKKQIQFFQSPGGVYMVTTTPEGRRNMQLID